MLEEKSTQAKALFACSQMQITRSCRLQRPDLGNCTVEAMFSLFIAEHCSVNTSEHLEEIVKNYLSYKGDKLQLR